MEITPHRILIVDDDTELCSLLSKYLESAGFSVEAVHNGESAIQKIKCDDRYQAIILDIMMPTISGLEVLQALRQFSDVPVLMLTGRGDDVDRIVGLELGADDYLGKPCNPRELAARLNAIFRRTQGTHPSIDKQPSISRENIELNTETLEVFVSGKKINFTSAEFRILQLLFQNHGKTLSKEILTQEVLNRPLTAFDRSIDVHVSRIRQKISQTDAKMMIKAIRGIGYQLATIEL